MIRESVSTDYRRGAKHAPAYRLQSCGQKWNYGLTAGVSTFIPRARHIRNSSRSTYSSAP